MVMSGMSQQGGAGRAGGLLGMLDADGDGSVADDVLGLAARFLQK
jgi:hypothetical protein